MLDKLSVTSDIAVDIESVVKALSHVTYVRQTSRSQYYERVLSLNFRGGNKDHFLAISVGPHWPSISPTKIDLNPSRFSSFGELTQVLEAIVPTDRLRVTRLDHTVDVKFPLEEVNDSLLFARKSAYEKYKRDRPTGFYYGQHPERLAVYDRAYLLKTEGPLTRLELRQYREKLPIKKYSDLPKLCEFNPFKALKFLEVDEDIQKTPSQSIKAQHLRTQIAAHGFHLAVKINNRDSNFHRRFQSVLRPKRNMPDLNHLYQQNMHRFFKPQETVQFAQVIHLR